MIKLSLSELQSLAKLAARGTGYYWGQAEEAGRICRQLEQHQLPGLQALRILLDRHLSEQNEGVEQNGNIGQHIPHLMEHNWKAHDWMCGLITSICLSDRRQHIITSTRLDCHHVISPLLLATALHQIAVQTHKALAMSWDDVRITCTDTAIYQQGDNLTPKQPQHVQIHITTQQPQSPPLTTTQPPLEITQELRQHMVDITYNTYVPNSEVSRRGAG